MTWATEYLKLARQTCLVGSDPLASAVYQQKFVKYLQASGLPARVDDDGVIRADGPDHTLEFTPHPTMRGGFLVRKAEAKEAGLLSSTSRALRPSSWFGKARSTSPPMSTQNHLDMWKLQAPTPEKLRNDALDIANTHRGLRDMTNKQMAAPPSPGTAHAYSRMVQPKPLVHLPSKDLLAQWQANPKAWASQYLKRAAFNLDAPAGFTPRGLQQEYQFHLPADHGFTHRKIFQTHQLAKQGNPAAVAAIQELQQKFPHLVQKLRPI